MDDDSNNQFDETSQQYFQQTRQLESSALSINDDENCREAVFYSEFGSTAGPNDHLKDEGNQHGVGNQTTVYMLVQDGGRYMFRPVNQVPYDRQLNANLKEPSQVVPYINTTTDVGGKEISLNHNRVLSNSVDSHLNQSFFEKKMGKNSVDSMVEKNPQFIRATKIVCQPCGENSEISKEGAASGSSNLETLRRSIESPKMPTFTAQGKIDQKNCSSAHGCQRPEETETEIDEEYVGLNNMMSREEEEAAEAAVERISALAQQAALENDQAAKQKEFATGEGLGETACSVEEGLKPAPVPAAVQRRASQSSSLLPQQMQPVNWKQEEKEKEEDEVHEDERRVVEQQELHNAYEYDYEYAPNTAGNAALRKLVHSPAVARKRWLLRCAWTACVLLSGAAIWAGSARNVALMLVFVIVGMLLILGLASRELLKWKRCDAELRRQRSNALYNSMWQRHGGSEAPAPA